MIKTVNRMPASTSTPSRADVNDKFFNHYDWKGVNDDKNFFSVDPFTFANSNNVYADSEGLLRSRPATKIKTITDGKITLSNIVNCWVFGDVTVYQSELNSVYYITFADKNYKDFSQYPCESDIRIIAEDGKLFVFSSISFNYYDIETREYLTADDFIYIPTTNIITDGQADKKLESKNVFTGSEKTTYIYTNLFNNTYDIFIGKDIELKIGNDAYKINFKQDNELVFVDRYSKLTNNNFIINDSDKSIYTIIGAIPPNYKYPLVFTSEKQSTLIGTYISRKVDVLKLNTSWTIYHTVDGLTYNTLPVIDEVLGLPMISKDGNFAFVFRKDGPYVINLLKSDEAIKYPVWTNLLVSLDAQYGTSWYQDVFVKNKYNLNQKYTDNSEIHQNQSLNGYFLTDTNFSFCFQDTDISDVSNPKARAIIITRNEGKYYVHQIAVDAYDAIKQDTPVRKVYSEMLSAPNIAFEEISGKVYTAVMFKTPYMRMYADNGTVDVTSEWLVKYVIRDTEKIVCELEVIDGLWAKVGGLKPPGMQIYDCALNRPMLDHGLNFVDNKLVMCYACKDLYGNKPQEYYTSVRTVDIPSLDKDGIYLKDTSKIFKISEPTGYLLTEQHLYPQSILKINDTNVINLLRTDFIPIAYFYAGNNFDSIYLASSDALYTSKISRTLEITVTNKNTINYNIFDSHTLLSNHYISKANKLYISERRQNENGDFLWYFPEVSIQSFGTNITNLHVISDTSVAIFFKDSIQYVSYDNEVNAYRYYKSKLSTGCLAGSDVITTLDGKFTVFNTNRGLVAMSYQDFIASEEQTLSYLTDTIYDMYDKFNNGPVKLFANGFWIFVYRTDSKQFFLFDTRNNSWWPMTLLNPITKIVRDDKPIFLLNKSIVCLDSSDGNYYDYDSKKHKISWFIQSQKLYLKAINYYKHIINMTFVSVHDTDNIAESNTNVQDTGYKLSVNVYRKKIDTNIGTDDFTTIDYNIENIRTFVQRLNYSKVNEFEYMLTSDDERAFDVPLSLSSITIKYKIGGQVR